MDQKHLNTLDFPQILSRLAEYTSFSASRDLALALKPSPIVAEVRQRLQETREACHILGAHPGISFGGVRDVRPLAHNAQRGGTLQPTELLEIYDTLRAARRVRQALIRLRESAPLLADMAARIELCEALVDEIGRCINDQGEVVDHASDKLARIRREMRTTHERLLERLNRIITSPKYSGYLQELLITQRNGRYVIPLKAEFRGRIPGIVHDTSSSGATLFIEPLFMVEMGNQWRELQMEEEREVQRILAELSAMVAELGDELIWTVEALAELDLAFAKARYADALDATEPQIVPFRKAAMEAHPGSTLDLRQARHPLLDPARVVPIDVYLSDEYFILVITGPNTGGKTVALKTVGLLAAMAQSGLFLPAAEGSALSVFSGLYADIGDEQSIEQSLSTFSAHLTNIIRILHQADEQSLVLLDELGAGTDPVEGSALARALLMHLLARRITTLVATHYSELKAFAQTTPGVENASVEFDLETLAPTYKMRIGLPGRSNAFAIAERLGLPGPIVEAARLLVSPDERKTESLLAEIQQAHQEAIVARDRALQAERRAAELERRLAARLAAIEEERATILSEARAEAQRHLEQLRREIERLRAELAEPRRRPSVSSEWLAQARAQVAEQEKAIRTSLSAPSLASPRPSAEIAVGDTVWVRTLGALGRVTSLDDASAEVQVGAFGVRVPRRDLEWRASAEPAAVQRSVHLTGARPSASLELNLRGQRIEEALPILEKYLDDAFLSGLPFVRIIHGKGTGALRQAVREQLRNHPLVKSYREGNEEEGGTGVTIAYLDRD